MTVLYGLYAVVLLAGGMIGYVKAKSLPSLAAGAVSAVLMGVATALLPDHIHTGLEIGGVVSLALFFVFGARYRKTRKAMPSLPIMAFSIVIFFAAMFTLFPPPHA